MSKFVKQDFHKAFVENTAKPGHAFYLCLYYALQRSYSAYMPWQFRLSVCLSVRPSVCHTGGSAKNG